MVTLGFSMELKHGAQNGVTCNYVIVAAYTNKDDKKNGISIFIVDKNLPDLKFLEKFIN